MSDSKKSAELKWKGEKGEESYSVKAAGKATLGRDKGNQVVLIGRKVSKVHAIIEWKDKQFILIDQNSTNGTFVNDKKISKPTTLKNGDLINIGGNAISFTLTEAAPAAPPADLKTKIYDPASMEEPAKAAEKKAVEPVETRIYEEAAVEEAPAKAAEEAPKEDPLGEKIKQELAEVETGIKKLVDELKAYPGKAQSIQQSIDVWKEKENKAKANLEKHLEKLASQVRQLSAIEAKITEVDLSGLLNRLSEDTRDVNLLIELADHIKLLIDMTKNFTTKTKTFKSIQEAIQKELDQLG